MRRAFNYAFDFEEMNKQLFYGQYKRIASYFEGHRAGGARPAEGQELKILEAVRDKVPAEVFTTPYVNPVGGNPEKVARQSARGGAAAEGSGLRGQGPQAGRYQDGQGCPRRDFGPTTRTPNASCCSTSRRWNGSGSTSSFAPSMMRNTRTVMRNWDFDIVIASWGESLSPGNEQRAFWGSQAAESAGIAQSRRHQESGRGRDDRAE